MHTRLLATLLALLLLWPALACADPTASSDSALGSPPAPAASASPALPSATGSQPLPTTSPSPAPPSSANPHAAPATQPSTVSPPVGRVVGPDFTYYGAFVVQYATPPQLEQRDVVLIHRGDTIVGEAVVISASETFAVVLPRGVTPAVGDSVVFSHPSVETTNTSPIQLPVPQDGAKTYVYVYPWYPYPMYYPGFYFPYYPYAGFVGFTWYWGAHPWWNGHPWYCGHPAATWHRPVNSAWRPYPGYRGTPMYPRSYQGGARGTVSGGSHGGGHSGGHGGGHR